MEQGSISFPGWTFGGAARWIRAARGLQILLGRANPALDGILVFAGPNGVDPWFRATFGGDKAWRSADDAWRRLKQGKPNAALKIRGEAWPDGIGAVLLSMAEELDAVAGLLQAAGIWNEAAEWHLSALPGSAIQAPFESLGALLTREGVRIPARTGASAHEALDSAAALEEFSGRLRADVRDLLEFWSEPTA